MFLDAHAYISRYGYSGMFGLLLLGIVGIPVPDETLLATAGFLIRRGELRPGPTILTALGGSMCGLTVSYIIGRTVGHRLLHSYGGWFHLTEESLARFHRWYARAGRWSLTFGYFIPGFRHLTAIASGMSGLPWHTFGLFAYAGATLWVVVVLLVGYEVGQQWGRTSQAVHRAILLAVLGAVLIMGSALLVRFVRRRRRV